MMGAYLFALLGMVCSLIPATGALPGENCTLKIFREGSDKTIDNLCVRQYTTPDCRKFVNSFNTSDLPEGYDLTENDFSVEKPASLDITGKMNLYKGYIHRPGMLISFVPPYSKHARYAIKGYLVVWKTQRPLPDKSIEDIVKCRLYQFDSDVQRQYTEELKFEFDIEFVLHEAQYEVRIYSMPPPEDLESSRDVESYASTGLTTGSLVRATSDAGDWIPFIIYKKTCGGSLVVKISRSPAIFNLTHFEVMLVRVNVDDQNPFLNQSLVVDLENPDEMYDTTFDGLEADLYKVVVHVIDPYRLQEDRCMCWQIINGEKKCKNACGNVQTGTLNITEQDTLPCPVEGDPHKDGNDDSLIPTSYPVQGKSNRVLDDTVVIVLIALGSLFLIGAVVAAIYLKRRGASG